MITCNMIIYVWNSYMQLCTYICVVVACLRSHLVKVTPQKPRSVAETRPETGNHSPGVEGWPGAVECVYGMIIWLVVWNMFYVSI